jgi:hypothetical protein
MMIARWQIEVRFGHKQAALELMRQWWREIAPQVGWHREQARVLSGSLGARESTVEIEITIADLTALESAWTRLADAKGQAEWSAALEPHVVSGTPRWLVYRVVE